MSWRRLLIVGFTILAVVSLPAGPGAGRPAHAEPHRPQCGEYGCGTQLLTAWDRQYNPGCGPPPSGPLLPGDSDGCSELGVFYGESLQFFNTDVPGARGAPGHSVIEVNPHGPPRFESEMVPLGAVAEVEGVPDLTPGTYFFSCRVHPEMRGKIHVVAGGFGIG